MTDISIRAMDPEDWAEVGALIRDSLNAWYESHALGTRFPPDSDVTQWFCKIYEAMDPGCCVLAQDIASGDLLASCFYHPRPTHVSLGIMNVHPKAFGRGCAGQLLEWVTEFAARRDQPVRLVSSALNLDSYSLYTRAGFVPYGLFQTMSLAIPAEGFKPSGIDGDGIRAACLDDVPAVVALEGEISGIERSQDYRHFLANDHGIWHMSVHEDEAGAIDGCLVAVVSPASRMLGPGIARNESIAAALIAAELDRHRGYRPVWLVPADAPGLVRQMYAWGARNVEMHVAQVLGEAQPPAGIVMPTFMPETG